MSYPSVLAGPASLSESSPESVRIIRGSAAFRSEQRLPALTWSSGVDGASLWRASQPKVGLQGNRSTADEILLKHIAESAMSTNALREGPAIVQPSTAALQHLCGSSDLKDWTLDSNCQLKILDLRPKSSAMANRTGGTCYYCDLSILVRPVLIMLTICFTADRIWLREYVILYRNDDSVLQHWKHSCSPRLLPKDECLLFESFGFGCTVVATRGGYKVAIAHSSHFGGILGDGVLDSRSSTASLVALQSWLGSYWTSGCPCSAPFGSILSYSRRLFNIGGEGFHVFWTSFSYEMRSW